MKNTKLRHPTLIFESGFLFLPRLSVFIPTLLSFLLLLAGKSSLFISLISLNDITLLFDANRGLLHSLITVLICVFNPLILDQLLSSVCYHHHDYDLFHYYYCSCRLLSSVPVGRVQPFSPRHFLDVTNILLSGCNEQL